jgi:hypothetical protein
LSIGSSENSCTTYYFLDFTTPKQQNEIAILQSILQQVVEHDTEEAISVLLKRRNERSRPKPGDLSLALAEVCRKQKKTYLILDAPDELETRQIVSRLQSFVDAGCRVLVTSRDQPDLREAFQTARQIEACSSSEGLALYIEHRFGETDFRDKVGKTHDIVDAIVKKSNGL